MAKIELLAPAGDLEKAYTALRYGADAVYVGGKKFSLRARASNFSLEDIQKLTAYAHKHHKKVYVTMNIVAHDEDLEGLDDYIKALDKIKVDAVIASSGYIIERVKVLAKNLTAHLSTQASLTNHLAIPFYQNLGVTRVVLAREVSIEEIAMITKNTSMPLEVFIHGGMCSAMSGRCVLSNHMTLRDANRGGCAHSCRWNYSLYHDSEAVLGTYNIGSKDLMALKYLPRLIELGVSSLKIEGRMKSAYYLATVVRAYRMLIDRYYDRRKCQKTLTAKDFALAEIEIKKAENRETSKGFYEGCPGVFEQLYDNRTEIPTKEYVGYVKNWDKETKIATIEQRNYFEPGDEIEVFGPKFKNHKFVVAEIKDGITHDVLDAARHPLQILEIMIPFEVKPHFMLRKVFKEANKS